MKENADPVGNLAEGTVKPPVVPKMVPSNLLGMRKSTKVVWVNCLNVIVVIIFVFNQLNLFICLG